MLVSRGQYCVSRKVVVVRVIASLALATIAAACLHQPPLERGIGNLSAESDSSVRYRVAESVHRFYTINGQLGRRSPLLQLRSQCRGNPSGASCAEVATKLKEDSVSHVTLRASAAALANELAQLARRGATDPSIAEIRFFVYAFVRDAPQLRSMRPACDSTAWWCDALDGLANHRLFDTEGAERSFERMFVQMDSATRCSWQSLPEVAGLNCDHRGTDDERMWWLGDPLWLEPGNDRWT